MAHTRVSRWPRTSQAAAGFDYDGKTDAHASVTRSHGYGGKFGVDKSAQGKNAVGSFEAQDAPVGTNYERPQITGQSGMGGTRNKFESMKQQKDTRRPPPSAPSPPSAPRPFFFKQQRQHTESPGPTLLFGYRIVSPVTWRGQCHRAAGAGA